MPVAYTVELDGFYANATATGVLTADEVCEYLKAVDTDDSVGEEFVELFDASRITESQIDKSGLERIAEVARECQKRSRGSRLAIVVAKGDSFDRARYFERIARDVHDVIVFNTRDVAETWLGVRQRDADSSA